jgi:hypothetical protein
MFGFWESQTKQWSSLFLFWYDFICPSDQLPSVSPSIWLIRVDLDDTIVHTHGNSWKFKLPELPGPRQNGLHSRDLM